MPAPIENRYIKEWTLEASEDLFKEALKELQKDEEIIFIGSLAAKVGYYHEVFENLSEKYGSISPIIRNIKKAIHQICEARLIEKAAKNKINAVFAMFILKCHHKYIEPSNQPNQLDINIRIPRLDGKEVKQIEEKIKLDI